MRFPILLALALFFVGAESVTAQLPLPDLPVEYNPTFRYEIQPHLVPLDPQQQLQNRLTQLEIEYKYKVWRASPEGQAADRVYQEMMETVFPSMKVPTIAAGTNLASPTPLEIALDNYDDNTWTKIEIEIVPIKELSVGAIVLEDDDDWKLIWPKDIKMEIEIPPVNPVIPQEMHNFRLEEFKEQLRLKSNFGTIPANFATAGDILRNGGVDEFDLHAFQKHYPKASGSTWDTGDFDGDGDTDFQDLVSLASNFTTAMD